jgi:hypothetical protein
MREKAGYQMSKLNKAPSTENFVCRLVSEDGRIEMGIMPVLYGFRVRAGYVGDGCCPIGWCCGDSEVALMTAYSVLKLLLEKGIAFDSMPSHSNIKPYFKDEFFSNWINENLKDVGELEALPPLDEIRREYMGLLNIFIAGNK